jgi:hypothetical protein
MLTRLRCALTQAAELARVTAALDAARCELEEAEAAAAAALAAAPPDADADAGAEPDAGADSSSPDGAPSAAGEASVDGATPRLSPVRPTALFALSTHAQGALQPAQPRTPGFLRAAVASLARRLARCAALAEVKECRLRAMALALADKDADVTRLSCEAVRCPHTRLRLCPSMLTWHLA